MAELVQQRMKADQELSIIASDEHAFQFDRSAPGQRLRQVSTDRRALSDRSLAALKTLAVQPKQVWVYGDRTVVRNNNGVTCSLLGEWCRAVACSRSERKVSAAGLKWLVCPRLLRSPLFVPDVKVCSSLVSKGLRKKGDAP